MKTVTLKIDDSVHEKFIGLLEHFSPHEIAILEQTEYIDDDSYIRSVDGMVESIIEAKNEPLEKGVKLDKLDW